MIVDDVTPSPPVGDAAGFLDRFRTGLYSCLTRRGDALFELADAVACAPAAVTDLARLSLEAEHQRGHGALYDGLNAGGIDTGRLRCLVCAGPLPKVSGPDGRARIVLAVDVSNWLRPDAATSGGTRLLPHLTPAAPARPRSFRGGRTPSCARSNRGPRPGRPCWMRCGSSPARTPPRSRPPN